ncbi:hypothetical protein ACER0C_023783 [Sarotherodon galilaeus]
MSEFKIGTLNLNGARDEVKRAAFFELMDLKKLDIMLVQETHSTGDNESDWRRGCGGNVFFSHKSSCSGGVGIVFSKNFLPVSCEAEEIIKGCLLKRRQQADSLYWLLEEPVLFGSLLDCPVGGRTTLSRRLHAAQVCSLKRVVELAGPRLDAPEGLAAQLGIRSTRVVGQLLDHWKRKLGGVECSLLGSYCDGSLSPNHLDPYPSIRLFPGFQNCFGPLLDNVDVAGVSLEGASGKTLYRLLVKTLNQDKLNGRNDTVWRTHLSLAPDIKPAWRSLYKPPLTKKHADLQWRILHGIAKMAVYMSRKRKVTEGLNVGVVPVFVNMVKSRLLLEFNFYKTALDLHTFSQVWGYRGAICSVVEGHLVFGQVLM